MDGCSVGRTGEDMLMIGAERLNIWRLQQIRWSVMKLLIFLAVVRITE